MKDRTLIIVGVILAFYLITRQRQYPPRPQYVQRGSPEWLYWANTVIDIAGGLSDQLFGPGGPFYKENPQVVANLTNYSGYIPYGV